MNRHRPAAAAHDAPAALDVGPEAIAALVTIGASALQLPAETDNRDAAPVRLAHPEALDLLIGVTHDLRSPLSSMLVLVERLRAGQAGPLTPEQERQLDLLYGATFGLAAITNAALDVAREAAATSGEAPVPFSISTVLRSVQQVVQPIAEEKGLRLRCCAPAGDLRVGHPSVLHRVLLNLVTNALKYTGSGAVTLTAHGVGETAVSFEVVDTGRGMPENVLTSLASPARSLTAVSRGGLGLGMCRRLLEDLGSELRIERREPVGTRVQFTIELPAP